MSRSKNQTSDASSKRLINKKHTTMKSKNSISNLNDAPKPLSRSKESENGVKMNTLISATLMNKNGDQTYITQENSGYEIESTKLGKPRIDTTSKPTREGTANRLPPGVRLYNQAKNPKGRDKGKKKNGEPPKPVLTKNIEEMLIQSNREKCEEVIKSSNSIHETLVEAGMDKQSMVEALFSDPLFRHVLANMLFHSKILGKNKLENFLHTRIKTFIKEYETDRQIKENLNNIHQKIQDRIKQLKNIRKKYHDDFDTN
jgi:hypothetical protein